MENISVLGSDASGSQVEVVRNTNTTLVCNATGTPPLTFSWRKEGSVEVLQEREVPEAMQDTLVLLNVDQNATGSYQCIVSNTFTPSEQTERTNTNQQNFTVIVIGELFVRLFGWWSSQCSEYKVQVVHFENLS